ncbi:hypothetical protein ACMT1E_04340 [Sphingomonas flavalba]|uniref:hypothetical protein n=1 Tax=Sphingomonas flavalba TaxID=2559804 RepID=UPI0039E07424
MTTQASQTRIVNKALTILGSTSRVLSLTDNSPAAKVAFRLWDETRDEVLAEHPWNFAVARTDIARSGDHVPATGWSAAFELPADLLRWLPWREDHPDHFAGEQEGQYILANGNGPLFIRYIRRIEDVARWSSGFTAAFTARLGFYMARPITASGTMMDRMERMYDKAMADARRQDGLATGRTARTASFRSDWLGARERPYGA